MSSASAKLKPFTSGGTACLSPSGMDVLSRDYLAQAMRYRIIDKIATGGQSKIYRATDTSTRALVALKELILPVNAGVEVRNRSLANVKKETLLLSASSELDEIVTRLTAIQVNDRVKSAEELLSLLSHCHVSPLKKS